MRIREKGDFIENENINSEDDHLKFLRTDRGHHYERYKTGPSEDRLW